MLLARTGPDGERCQDGWVFPRPHAVQASWPERAPSCQPIIVGRHCNREVRILRENGLEGTALAGQMATLIHAAQAEVLADADPVSLA